jgi:phage-related protein
VGVAIVKGVKWASGTLDALKELPDAVRKEFGHELFLVQKGESPENASPFEGSSGTNIMKLVERYDKDTYRCVYAAKLETCVYVLHVFMKKSHEGKRIPKHVIETVKARYRDALEMDKAATGQAATSRGKPGSAPDSKRPGEGKIKP